MHASPHNALVQYMQWMNFYSQGVPSLTDFSAQQFSVRWL